MSRSKVSDKYVKMKPEEHVLARPGMYIGSMEKDEFNTWVLDEKNEKMIKKNIKYVPGLYKISSTFPEHGVLFTWQSKTFMKTLILLNFLFSKPNSFGPSTSSTFKNMGVPSALVFG